ncbi:MAG: HlyD family efflux transporter periplasmic adaptor subunit [Anaerotignum sp.]
MKRDSSKNRIKKHTQDRQRQVQRIYPSKENVYQFAPSRKQDMSRTKKREYPSVKEEADRPRARKRNIRVSRVLPMFVFIVIGIYLLGQMIGMASKSADVNVETVEQGGIDTPEKYTGLIVRNEEVVNSNRAGQPYYEFSDGNYVSKNTVVCTVKDTDSTDEIETALEKVDQDILKTQKIRTDISAFSEDITRIEENIERVVDSYAGKSMKTDLSYLYDMKDQVETHMDQRNEIWLSENVESFSQLTEEKSQYEKELAQNQSAVQAPESGTIALSYDGLEQTLTPEGIEELTKDQIGDSKINYISKTEVVAEGEPLFKLVKSNEWYIVVFVPNSEVVNWNTGDRKALNLQLQDGAVKINSKVESLQVGEKETRVVFSTYEQMELFMEKRVLEFYLDTASIQGLKVPNNAIVEKSLISVPKDCVTESLGKDGVLLVNGGNAKFLAVSIISSDDENCYIDQNGELKLGDVVLQGTGEDATQHTIANLMPKTGVYVANSSMAKFVSVDILDQNQEYAIVRSGTNYGLQAYDMIVSDAKNIKEGQSLY